MNALCHQALGNVREAEMALKRALQSHPADPRAMCTLGALFQAACRPRTQRELL